MSGKDDELFQLRVRKTVKHNPFLYIVLRDLRPPHKQTRFKCKIQMDMDVDASSCHDSRIVTQPLYRFEDRFEVWVHYNGTLNWNCPSEYSTIGLLCGISILTDSLFLQEPMCSFLEHSSQNSCKQFMQKHSLSLCLVFWL